MPMVASELPSGTVLLFHGFNPQIITLLLLTPNNVGKCDQVQRNPLPPKKVKPPNIMFLILVMQHNTNCLIVWRTDILCIVRKN